MRLVVDTNALVAALLRDSTARRILLSPDLELYSPETLLEEVEGHKGELVTKSGLAPEDLENLLSDLLRRVAIVPVRRFKPHLAAAERAIGTVDENDAPLLAAALAVKASGVWSDDSDFQKQGLVKVFRTKDLVEKM